MSQAIFRMTILLELPSPAGTPGAPPARRQVQLAIRLSEAITVLSYQAEIAGAPLPRTASATADSLADTTAGEDTRALLLALADLGLAPASPSGRRAALRRYPSQAFPGEETVLLDSEVTDHLAAPSGHLMLLLRRDPRVVHLEIGAADGGTRVLKHAA